MKTGMDVMAERGVDMSPDHWSGADFDNAGLPMVVHCTNCEKTMAFPSCVVLDCYTYCKTCGEQQNAADAREAARKARLEALRKPCTMTAEEREATKVLEVNSRLFDELLEVWVDGAIIIERWSDTEAYLVIPSGGPGTTLSTILKVKE